MSAQFVRRLVIFIFLVASSAQVQQALSDSPQYADRTSRDRQAELLTFTHPLYSPDNTDDVIGYAFELSAPTTNAASSGDIIFVPSFSIDSINALGQMQAAWLPSIVVSAS